MIKLIYFIHITRLERYMHFVFIVYVNSVRIKDHKLTYLKVCYQHSLSKKYISFLASILKNTIIISAFHLRWFRVTVNLAAGLFNFVQDSRLKIQMYLFWHNHSTSTYINKILLTYIYIVRETIIKVITNRWHDVHSTYRY